MQEEVVRQTEDMIPRVKTEFEKALDDLFDLMDELENDEAIQGTEQFKAAQEYLKNKEEQPFSFCCTTSSEWNAERSLLFHSTHREFPTFSFQRCTV